jgi:hypothetical protein
LLLAAVFTAARPRAATSAMHATWSCGSVLAPKRFAFPAFGDAPRDSQVDLVAGQAACAEERDVVAARSVVLLIVAGSFGVAAWAVARKQPDREAIDAAA